MSLFFEIPDPDHDVGQTRYVRAGLESDEVSQPELSFWVGLSHDYDPQVVLEIIQRYTRWLDDRGLLNFGGGV